MTEGTEHPPQAHEQIRPRARSRAIVTRVGHETHVLLPLIAQGSRLMVVLVVVCGVLYPLLIFATGQFAFPSQANGSLVQNASGQTTGSTLIGQSFSSPAYFHGRPSAVGYDAASSGGSNLGPLNPHLLTGNGTQITVAPGTPPPPGSTPVPGKPNTYRVPGTYLGVPTYAAQFRAENGLAPDTPLPADIVTASGSGLDPDISVAAAALQVKRIVAARQALGGRNTTITPAAVRTVIARATEGRQLGFLGEPRVNVLELNLVLDAAFGSPPAPVRSTEACSTGG